MIFRPIRSTRHEVYESSVRQNQADPGKRFFSPTIVICAGRSGGQGKRPGPRARNVIRSGITNSTGAKCQASQPLDGLQSSAVGQITACRRPEARDDRQFLLLGRFRGRDSATSTAVLTYWGRFCASMLTGRLPRSVVWLLRGSKPESEIIPAAGIVAPNHSSHLKPLRRPLGLCVYAPMRHAALPPGRQQPNHAGRCGTPTGLTIRRQAQYERRRRGTLPPRREASCSSFSSDVCGLHRPKQCQASSLGSSGPCSAFFLPRRPTPKSSPGERSNFPPAYLTLAAGLHSFDPTSWTDDALSLPGVGALSLLRLTN
ncbi:uncharacterized protein N7482_005411 [Penicillium canariense]|uniref:Uncharacterized protein n=1 Tax=Penicillium canariense TaxID=189055 RepID=A0A9W9LN66_9EURO|nr:uncharacterized protein N7482_005411 [Penicillium canariense]KAJ5166630.1 hypothetical protein N7482_005411 [Penicillium canariense]